MSPDRLPEKRLDSRTPRIRRRLKKLGLPDLQIASGVTTKRELAHAEATVDQLIADRQVGVLRALIAGADNGGVTLAQIIDVRRAGLLTGAGILATVAMRERLWPTADEPGAVRRLFAAAAVSRATRQRYEVAFAALRRKAARWLGDDARLADLALVPWGELSRAWGASGDDWENMRRAVSRLLTLALRGDKYHPARREIMATIPRQATRTVVPDLTPALFWRIVEAARPDVQPALVTLLLTGMRVRSEYLQCGREHLRPHTHGVLVHGSKTAGSHAVVQVSEELWPWITAAIPAPLAYKHLRRQWMLACHAAGAGTYTLTETPILDAAGMPVLTRRQTPKVRRTEHYEGLTLHALRHAHGQWSTDAGVPLVHVKASMRHATLAVTEKYARQAAKGEVARALGSTIRRGRAAG